MKALASIAITMLLFIPGVCSSATDSTPQESRNLCTGVEYYFPKDESREIQSVFTYALLGREFLNQLHYSLYGGLIATYAWGNIIQLDENFNDVKYSTTAIGIGPAVMIRVDFLRYGGFHFSGDFLVGVILYSTHFPPEGDIYNFFRKYGLAVGIALDTRHEIDLCARDMHVSNGQGVNAHNPSYEGFGISAEYIVHL
jgi:hypothetical protein